MHQHGPNFHIKIILLNAARFSSDRQNKGFWFRENKHVSVSYNTEKRFDINVLCFLKLFIEDFTTELYLHFLQEYLETFENRLPLTEIHNMTEHLHTIIKGNI